ncbi:proline-rich receptor-like protein kinase PERK2 [Malania oleifera]|uniref:proline-rich receptor-like protein kinase PERK2 n=1 Tax=Malania oleifera TaxID=397392 RepID=UPI0025AE78BF|nr:proline-rich receptor-like protein kinase PERK2 [Malania oleifera]
MAASREATSSAPTSASSMPPTTPPPPPILLYAPIPSFTAPLVALVSHTPPPAPTPIPLASAATVPPPTPALLKSSMTSGHFFGNDASALRMPSDAACRCDVSTPSDAYDDLGAGDSNYDQWFY